MTVTLTSKGQIAIPPSLRERIHLKAGDNLEFDETAPVLTARRVVHRSDWEKTLSQGQASAESALRGHPWKNQSSATILDDLRDGPAETPVTPP